MTNNIHLMVDLVLVTRTRSIQSAKKKHFYRTIFCKINMQLSDQIVTFTDYKNNHLFTGSGSDCASLLLDITVAKCAFLSFFDSQVPQAHVLDHC